MPESNVEFFLSTQEGTFKVIDDVSCELILGDATSHFHLGCAIFVDAIRNERLVVSEDQIVSIEPGFVRISGYQEFRPNWLCQQEEN